MKTKHPVPFTTNPTSRRAFLGDVGRGMVIASVGAAAANDLGFTSAFAETGDNSLPLTFGGSDSLVALMGETPPERLLEVLVAKLRRGEVSLKDLTTAGALDRTVTEEFASIRPMFRWRELIALARVTASAYGMNRSDQPGGRAPGYLRARELLGLS